MVDISDKIAKIMKLVERGNYFVINRPRQYGKTTTLFTLNRLMKKSEEYFPINISFEGIGEEGFQNAAVFNDAFFLLLKEQFMALDNNELITFLDTSIVPDRMDKLGLWVGSLVKKIGKKVVVMIDEVDKSSNNQLFLDFLGMLRNKYLKREEPGQFTFHSVILAGVHDVKTLKLKIRPESEAKYNSPWNIAVNFKIDMSFSPKEITSMLEQYTIDRQVTLDIPLFSEKLHYYTSGYPFLVSDLCKIIDEEILPDKNKNEWELKDLEHAVHLILQEENTNFDSLIKNLENDVELCDFVYSLIFGDAGFGFNTDNPIIKRGVLHGILKEDNSRLKVHNRVYEQRLYNYLASKLETSSAGIGQSVTGSYLDESGKLDIKKVFMKFQDFMKENYGEKDRDFVERNGRLLFLAFIRPILNGRGFDFKEVQVSEEKRLNVVITFDNTKYIIELKLWRGETYHQQGIRQLCDYLDRQNQQSGYLLIYDMRKESGRIGESDTIDTEGKQIFMAWV